MTLHKSLPAWWRLLLYAVFAGFLLIAERVFLQNVTPLRISLSFAAGLVAFPALSYGAIAAGCTGIFCGLFSDLSSPGAWCLHALFYCVIGYFAGIAAQRLIRRRFGDYCLLALFCSALCTFVTLLGVLVTWKSFPVGSMLLSCVAVTVCNAVIALPLYPAARLLLGRGVSEKRSPRETVRDTFWSTPLPVSRIRHTEADTVPDDRREEPADRGTEDLPLQPQNGAPAPACEDTPDEMNKADDTLPADDALSDGEPADTACSEEECIDRQENAAADVPGDVKDEDKEKEKAVEENVTDQAKET